MTKKIAIIGVGNCGGQITCLAEKKYDTLWDTAYINTSESDLSMIQTNSPFKFKIGEKEEIEGSGKNRLKMKEYLKATIGNILGNEDFKKMICEKKYCFIISSAAGGTGSGATPVLLDIMHQLFPFTNFILVTVLPQISSSLTDQGNALEFLDELYKVLDPSTTTYMMYDNEQRSDLPPTRILEDVNNEIVEDLRVLSGVDNYPTPYESIDEADMESIITTPGRLLVARINKNITEKVMEDNHIDDMLIKEIKQSAHCETDRNKKVVRWGVITYFTDAVNKLYTSELPKALDFVGTPIERFNHNAINPNKESSNFFYLIASGMSPINDRVKRITERIDEIKNSLAEDSSCQYVLDAEGASYSVLEARKKESKRINQPQDIDANSIFSKFM